MKNRWHSGKHRAVIAILQKEDISQAPDFHRLVEVHAEMSEEEKDRTRKYLKKSIEERSKS